MIQHWHPPTPKEHSPLPGGLQASTAVAFEQGEAGEGPYSLWKKALWADIPKAAQVGTGPP